MKEIIWAQHHNLFGKLLLADQYSEIDYHPGHHICTQEAVRGINI